MPRPTVLNDLGSNAVLDRAAKLRADMDYVESYLDGARQTEIETGLLMSAEGLLSDVREFIARDDDERANDQAQPGRTG